MIEFIMKIKSLSDSLAAIGEPVSDPDQIMNLLAGLGSNYVLWRSQMDNVIYANGFENFIEGLSVCPEKTVPTTGIINPEFVTWRRHDRLILSWIYSSLTPEIMA